VASVSHHGDATENPFLKSTAGGCKVKRKEMAQNKFVIGEAFDITSNICQETCSYTETR
jgi:hypothetical protein